MTDITTVIADLQKALTDAQAANSPPPSSSILAPLISTAWIPQYGKTQSVLAADITAAWNGAAFDYATSTMHVVCCGGHGDSWCNQCFAYDVTAGSWRETLPQTTFPPDGGTPGYVATEQVTGAPVLGTGYDADGVTPVTPVVNGAVIYCDGHPSSRHTYGGSVWLPTQKRVLQLSGSPWHAGARDAYCGWFDPVSGTWERKANVPEGYEGISATYDAPRDCVIWNTHGTETIRSYNPATDTHTTIGSASGDPLWSDTGVDCRIIAVGDFLYGTRRKGWPTNLPSTYVNAIVRMPLGQTTRQKWAPVTVTGDMTAIYGECPGIEYDPERNALVFWGTEDPGNVSILSLDTMTVTKVALPSTPSITNTIAGVWGRFRRYAPNQYCLFYDANQPVMLITLP